MTAYNINIEQFINILIDIRERGIQLMNLDMVPDESNPQMNKLIIHPNENIVDRKPLFKPSDTPEDLGADNIKDPDIEGDDIFNLFSKVL